MSIRFSIVSTRLSGKPQYVGRVALQGTLDREALVKRMLERSPGLSKHNVRATLGLLAEVVEAVCLEGFRVNLEGFLMVSPVLRGPFDGPTDTFQHGRNTLTLKAQVSRLVNQRVLRLARPKKLSAEERRPLLFAFDAPSAEGAVSLRPGTIVSLKGCRLKFGNLPGEGLRLVNAEDPQEAVSITELQKVSDKELVFLMPGAPFSQGFFQVSSSLGTATIRTGRSEAFLIG
jgi:hypothetical protein